MKTIIAALFLLGGSFLMLSLGVWQLDRLTWKQSIIKELDRVYSSSNLPLYSGQNLQDANDQGKEFLYGHLKGTPLWDKEILYGPKSKDRIMGHHVITPVRITGGKTILVNRGWVEQDSDLSSNKTNQNIMFTGLFRKPDWNSFTPNNSPENNIWTKLDVEEIATSKQLTNVLPYILFTHKTSQNIDAVQLHEEKWYPRNKHAQYATFWFSMAGIFIFFFGYYAYRQKRN